MKRSITLAAFLVACGGSGTNGNRHTDAAEALDTSAAPDEAAPPPSARGLFVPVNFDSNPPTIATQALALPDVDGIAVDLTWSEIAAALPRSYDFTKLDVLLQLARAANKGVELSIIWAGGTPSWFDPASVIHLQYTPHNGATGRCYDTIAPPPWDANFLLAWDDMTAQLASHVATAGFSNTVVALRLTGLNASTPETHLPAQSPAKLSNPPACLTVDSVQMWQKAGYTPAKIQMAWSAMITSWSKHFPSLPFELVLWPGTNDRFPPIDDQGAIVAPSANADQARYDAMVATAAQQLGARLVIGTWFLMTGTPADAVTVAYANHYSLATMWQTNLWWRAFENATHGAVPGSAACGGTLAAPVQCTDATYLDELSQGTHPTGLKVAAPARVLEVFLPDPTLYPDAAHQTHLALTQ